MPTPEFTVKDSGARKQFESGMQRDTTNGKILWHLTADGPMLRRWAVHLTKGADKYNPRNWMLADGPEEEERFRESAYRHFMQWYYGEVDEDHAAAVMFNMNGVEYVRDRNSDDRGGEEQDMGLVQDPLPLAYEGFDYVEASHSEGSQRCASAQCPCQQWYP